MPRYLRAALAVALALGGLAACGGGDGDDAPKASDGKKEQTRKAPPVAPLTGLPALDPAALSRPALTVKVDNADFGNVRPQSGLDGADVVYEEVTERGITRFAAIYNSQVPSEVGPVRSVRAMDPNLVWVLGGVFAYSGGVQHNVDLIRQAPVNSLDETQAGDAMFRSDAKQAPHDLFARPQAMFDRGGQPVPPPSLFEYLEAKETFAGEPVASFTVGFAPGYAPTYTYDGAANAWSRAIEGQPFVMASGPQVAPTNVIVQFTEYTAEGDGQVVGQGDAWVFLDGQLIRGRWERPAREERARYTDARGTPIELRPGTTWVELLPVGAPVDVVAPPPTTSAPAEE